MSGEAYSSHSQLGHRMGTTDHSRSLSGVVVVTFRNKKMPTANVRGNLGERRTAVAGSSGGTGDKDSPVP